MTTERREEVDSIYTIDADQMAFGMHDAPAFALIVEVGGDEDLGLRVWEIGTDENELCATGNLITKNRAKYRDNEKHMDRVVVGYEVAPIRIDLKTIVQLLQAFESTCSKSSRHPNGAKHHPMFWKRLKDSDTHYRYWCEKCR